MAEKLNLGILQPKTKAVFDLLADQPEMSGFTLIGGTALALQIGHRISNDLDFITLSGQLPERKLDMMMTRLAGKGHTALLTTEQSQISAFRIQNGESLLKYVRDYAIDTVKVTFIADIRNPNQIKFYKRTPKITIPDCRYTIMGLEGLKASKTLVLAGRIKSRDLYDLMILTRDHHYSIEQAMQYIEELGGNNSPEYYKAVLRGEMLLDNNDEGLKPVGVKTGMKEIYAFFNSRIDEYEIALAAKAMLPEKQRSRRRRMKG